MCTLTSGILLLQLTTQHIRKETDWLWEYYLLTDHPIFYDQCKEKGGQLRTSGWRRMYKVSVNVM